MLLVEQEYSVPLLSAIFEKTFWDIECQGISLDRDFIEDLYELILLKENDEVRNASFSQFQSQPKIIQVKKKKNKKRTPTPFYFIRFIKIVFLKPFYLSCLSSSHHTSPVKLKQIT